MTVFDWLFQIYLNKFEKGVIYEANFKFQDKGTGEEQSRSHQFKALSPEQAVRIKGKLENFYKRALSSQGFAKDFGLKHKDNGFFMNNLQRMTGTRNLKNNFRKGLMPGDVPMFAFSRYSYSLISDGIRKATLPKSVAPNNERTVSPEEKRIIKFRLLCSFGVGTAVFVLCLIALIATMLSGNLLSMASYASVSFFVISALICTASIKQYKELDNG